MTMDSLENLYLINASEKARIILYQRADKLAKRLVDAEKGGFDLYQIAAAAGAIRLKMLECGKENLDFPERGFNQAFLDWIISSWNLAGPCANYFLIIAAVHAGDSALETLKLPPDLLAFEAYCIAQSPRLQEGLQRLASTCEPLGDPLEIPDADESFRQICNLVGKQKNTFLRSYQDMVGGREDASQEADLGLINALNKKVSQRAFDVAQDAFNNRLVPYLVKAMKNSLIDALRVANRYRKERTWSAFRTQGEEGEVQALMEMLAGKYGGACSATNEVEVAEPWGLRDLDIDLHKLNKLTSRELLICEQVYSALKEGYDFDSKKGRSFHQLWGKDYSRNIKTFGRAKAKLKER